MAKPFVKWAGGKTSLLKEIHEALPKSFDAYREPFVGGGAVFWCLKKTLRVRDHNFEVHLNDVNLHLMQAYKDIQSKKILTTLIHQLRAMANDEETFYRTRERFSKKPSTRDFIYLNKTCFNGLYRVNRKGFFNVPFGKYKSPQICDEDNLWGCHRDLAGVKLTSSDFQIVINEASKGTFVFCDPPYLPRVHNQEFQKYSALGFGLADHKRLAEAARQCKRRGVKIMITNSGTEEVRHLYPSPMFHIMEVRGARSIGSTADRRGHVLDFIITNYKV